MAEREKLDIRKVSMYPENLTLVGDAGGNQFLAPLPIYKGRYCKFAFHAFPITIFVVIVSNFRFKGGNHPSFHIACLKRWMIKNRHGKRIE